jgi:YVTN family beta-propeller protein
MRRMLVLIALTGSATLALQAQDGPYRPVKEIQIGGEGGWDYLSVDGSSKRLYVSHATKAVVVDLSTDTVVGEITDTPGIHGAIAATPGRIFTSNGRGNNASIVDAKTLQTISKVETGGNPDFILFEPKEKAVYTFNGRGGSSTVIDASSGKVVATISLGGKPEAAVVDVAAGRVYVNLEDKNSVAVIELADRARRRGVRSRNRHKDASAVHWREQQADVDDGLDQRQDRRASADRVRRRLNVVRSRYRLRLLLLWRRDDDDCARGFAHETHCRPDAQDGAGGSHDGARSGDAPSLSSDGTVRAAAG